MAEQQTTGGGFLEKFLHEMNDYRYCPPSDNLWTVEFRVHGDTTNNNDKGIVGLYNNIIGVNESWRNSTFATDWKVAFPDNYTKKIGENYHIALVYEFLSNLGQANLGTFLANQVNITPFENQYDTSIGSELITHGGFLNMGRVFSGRVNTNTCNIGFLVSNWSISDILIEPWIAAVSQRGLIENTCEKSIRADIYINQYSTGTPTSGNKNLILRKQTILYNAFPFKRGQVELKYDSGSAGHYAVDVVNFMFDEYSVNYQDVFGENTNPSYYSSVEKYEYTENEEKGSSTYKIWEKDKGGQQQGSHDPIKQEAKQESTRSKEPQNLRTDKGMEEIKENQLLNQQTPINREFEKIRQNESKPQVKGYLSPMEDLNKVPFRIPTSIKPSVVDFYTAAKRVKEQQNVRNNMKRVNLIGNSIVNNPASRNSL